MELPHEGPFADLMWSDPDDITEAWVMSPRGAGWIFGEMVTKQFNHINRLELIARSHQLVMEGFKYFFGQRLVTVWSAPNYFYRCGNAASIMQVNELLERQFTMFSCVKTRASQTAYYNAVPYFL